MAAPNVIGWLLMTIAAVSMLANASGPEDACKGKSDGSSVDFSLEIPGEKAPENKLAVKATCAAANSGEAATFHHCDAPAADIANVRAGVNSYTFRSKSGTQHGLLCSRDAEPKIVPPFATEVCKLKDASANIEPRVGPLDPVRVAFKCNDAKTEIISCKGDGQKDWIKPDGAESYFGGKGKLNSIKCSSDEPPYISVSYPRDVCRLKDPKDKIAVKGGFSSVTVYFECNEQQDEILTCFPNKRNEANAFKSNPNPSLGRGYDFDMATIGRAYKLITCWRTLKPEIVKKTA